MLFEFAAFVAQVSKPAVSPISKSARLAICAASGFGNPRYSRLGSLRYVGLAIVGLSILTEAVQAQDHTLFFTMSDPGVSKTITNWGLDTTWTSADNMRRGLTFMGTNNVNIVRVGFLANAPLTNNDISATQKATLQGMANVAAMAGTNARWDIVAATESGVDPWYQSASDRVYPDRWAAVIQASQRYYNRNFWMVEPFNEPDYGYGQSWGWGEGSPQNLYDAIAFLQASTNFPGAYMAGGSTLSDDEALSWFNAISSRATMGTTHCLAGSAANYVNFLQAMAASNAVPFNPELHNVVEVIIGANYGLKGGIWWGTAERARGDFVKACQGRQLGYADDWPKWTAAAVYRGPNGSVQAFVGASERMAVTTSYRFFSRDRDVFYDGYGPQRDYTVTIPGGNGYGVNQPNAEKVVNISWGSDVQPAINGRNIVVNRNSSKVMEVANAGLGDGANIQQNAYAGGTHQQWDIVPLPVTAGGDQSYFTMTAAHSGKAADVNAFSFADGGNVQQWTNYPGVNQEWFFDYVSNGWFYVRSRWSGKYLDVASASTANGANIFQWSGTGQINQQWRLIPAGAAVEFVPPGAPTRLTARANALSVQLNWIANPEPDLGGYTVLRASNSGGPYEIVARGLTDNAFTDKSANQPRPYFYVVKAVDRSLNSSDNSAEVSATPTIGPTLVARFDFEANANDGSGNANHATMIGTSTFVAGRYGSAADLNGTDQYAMLPASLFVPVANFTIATWINWDGGAQWQRIFDFGNDTTQYLFLSPRSGANTLRFAIKNGGGEQIVETSQLANGQWVHVAVTLSGSVARLYVNGAAKATNSSISIHPADFAPVLNYIGKSQFADPLFAGSIDDFRIYNYALSPTEVAALLSTLAETPTGLTAAPGNYEIELSWNPSAKASSYSVKRSTSIGGPYEIIATGLTNATFADTDRPIGTTYYYVVSAINNNGETANSNEASAAAIAQVAPTLISAGAIWFYFDKATDLGTAWRSNFYNATSWSNGPARLGYGGDGEVTKIASNRQWTTYFRRGFYIPNPTNVTALNARLTRDDAAIIYLNGAEVWRDTNITSGAITYTTPANVALGGADETNWLAKALNPGVLIAGVNILAAEVHNQSLNSTDIGFDFALTAEVIIDTLPALTVTNDNGGIIVAWPAEASPSYFALQSTINLNPPVVWIRATNAAALIGNEWRVTLPSATNGQRFFRLQTQ